MLALVRVCSVSTAHMAKHMINIQTLNTPSRALFLICCFRALNFVTSTATTKIHDISFKCEGDAFEISELSKMLIQCCWAVSVAPEYFPHFSHVYYHIAMFTFLSSCLFSDLERDTYVLYDQTFVKLFI